ncbi:MAG: pyrroline-5-carboxylate reductase [Candidatus Omnitrophica bacterium]|nr:pyrroline-5-carboxylate reductase [Candidatus Omnitrophota bacterium]
MNCFKNKKIGVVGCGNMGGALIKALLSHRMVKSHRLYVYDTVRGKTLPYKKKYGARIVLSFEQLLRRTDILLLAVKPQDIKDLVKGIPKSRFTATLIISILAGTTISYLTKLLGNKAKIVRCMPNLGIVVGYGMTAVCKNRNVSLRDLSIAERIFSCCGMTVRIPEKYINVVTALSGSGPAYYFFLTELLTAEGMSRGIKRTNAEALAQHTALGAARLMQQSKASPKELRKRVTSPGGTTEAAFTVLGSARYKRFFSSAITKAIKRAEKLST